ncbi:hypothetical protein AAMO2058_000756300 [Amorphochlora amoebiformis]
MIILTFIMNTDLQDGIMAHLVGFVHVDDTLAGFWSVARSFVNTIDTSDDELDDEKNSCDHDDGCQSSDTNYDCRKIVHNTDYHYFSDVAEPLGSVRHVTIFSQGTSIIDWRINNFVSASPTAATCVICAATSTKESARYRSEINARCCAGNFFVCDQESAASVPSGKIPIIIESESSRVFGSEGHHTTILGLKFLQRYVKKGQKVLDYGTGTGIQAIAALKLGAESALAVDIDHEAVEVCGSNGMLNKVQNLEARLAQNVDGTEGPFDLCIANILPGVLIDLAPHLALYLKPGAQIGLTGLKKRDIVNIKRAFEQQFTFAEEHIELTEDDAHLPDWSSKWGDQTGWVLLVATRTSSNVDKSEMSAHAHGERSELQIFSIGNILIGLLVLLVMGFFPRLGKLKGD